MVVIIERSDSVSVLVGQVGPTDRDIWQFCIKTLTVDLLITLVQVHVVDGFTRVSVATGEKNYHHGNCGDRDLEEAAHLKRVIGVSFGRNSTDVLFEWPAKNFVLMGRDCLARGTPCRQRLGDSGTDGTLQMLAVGRQHEVLGSERGMRASYVKLASRPDFLKDSTSRPKK